jgi:hypothetical protein
MARLARHSRDTSGESGSVNLVESLGVAEREGEKTNMVHLAIFKGEKSVGDLTATHLFQVTGRGPQASKHRAYA